MMAAATNPIFGAMLASALALSACGIDTSQPSQIIEADGPIPPEAALTHHDWQSFILPGYRVLENAEGDLNNDGRDDVVLALAKDTEAMSEDGEPPLRPLFLLIRQADNSLKLEQRNDNALMCFDCGGIMGDPYAGIEVNSGGFGIYHYGGSGWRWTHEALFIYDADQKDWLLGTVKEQASNSFIEGEDGEIITIKTSADFGIVAFSDFKN